MAVLLYTTKIVEQKFPNAMVFFFFVFLFDELQVGSSLWSTSQARIFHHRSSQWIITASLCAMSYVLSITVRQPWRKERVCKLLFPHLHLLLWLIVLAAANAITRHLLFLAHARTYLYVGLCFVKRKYGHLNRALNEWFTFRKTANTPLYCMWRYVAINIIIL